VAFDECDHVVLQAGEIVGGGHKCAGLF
jgi:hypothetical protein